MDEVIEKRLIHHFKFSGIFAKNPAMNISYSLVNGISIHSHLVAFCLAKDSQSRGTSSLGEFVSDMLLSTAHNRHGGKYHIWPLPSLNYQVPIYSWEQPLALLLCKAWPYHSEARAGLPNQSVSMAQ